ncbi:hypothetical protein BD770DRAFT_469096 [Pilaira anomala]|nr:hypothetical protein BD770DRAFT_469096 [Pilaira anomala]
MPTWCRYCHQDGHTKFVWKSSKARILCHSCTHITRAEIRVDFEPTAFEFIKGIPCKYWAQKCYILDKNTISEATKATPLPPMMALAYFFSSQKLSLLSSEFQDDPTLQKLYAHCKEETLTRIPTEKSTAEALLEVCDQTNKQLKKFQIRWSPCLII